MPMSKDPKTLALRWFHEVWNLHDEGIIREVMLPGAVACLEGGTVTGPEEVIEKLYKPMIETFPDMQIEVEGAIAEGNDVAIKWIATATHSGNRFSFSGMTWMTFVDGKLVSGSDRFNLQALYHFIATGEAQHTIRKLPSQALA
jgi:hypothetical protein